VHLDTRRMESTTLPTSKCGSNTRLGTDRDRCCGERGVVVAAHIAVRDIEEGTHDEGLGTGRLTVLGRGDE